MVQLSTLLLLIVASAVNCRHIRPESDLVWDNDGMHEIHFADFITDPKQQPPTDWRRLARRSLEDNLKAIRKTFALHHPAKNVIFFLGDGMGISTLTAARIYLAQTRNLTGEDAKLSWERFPNVALSKVYSTNFQVPDSGSTATALVCGEKTDSGVIACNQQTEHENCSSQLGNELTSILHHAIDEGKWTGVVTTTRLTHASPACTYAHAADRDWEADSDMPSDALGVCPDIAAQFIEDPRNQQIKVFLGGGRRNFIPETMADPEYPTREGDREDDRDLTQEWLDQKAAMGLPSSKYAYVYNQSMFDAVDPTQVDYLFGAFERSHMNYELERLEDDGDGEPSLVEMTEKAIRILQRSEEGYFLFVESGRIDHGHHGNRAKRALTETIMFSDAVQKAIDMTCDEETLIVVTADHSHVFAMAGYPELHTDILAFDEDRMFGSDDKPYTTLGYTNGPGYFVHRVDDDDLEQPRIDLFEIMDDLDGDRFRFDAGIPRSSETHSGEDVAVFARGPMADLFMGTQEQSYFGNAMMYALCVGHQKELCELHHRKMKQCGPMSQCWGPPRC